MDRIDLYLQWNIDHRYQNTPKEQAMVEKVAALYAQWVEELKLTCGTSYVEQCKKYGD